MSLDNLLGKPWGLIVCPGDLFPRRAQRRVWDAPGELPRQGAGREGLGRLCGMKGQVRWMRFPGCLCCWGIEALEILMIC